MSVVNISKVFETITKIRSTTKRGAKTELLESLKRSPVAHAFFKLACDHLTNLWVISPDASTIFFSGKRKPEDMDKRWVAFQNLFKQLSTRKITGAAAQEAVRAFIASCNNEAPFFEGECYVGAINRHLNIGVANAAISKVWPDLVSDFAVQLAEPLYNQTSGLINPKIRDYILQSWPLVDEPKLDGVNGSTIIELSKNRVVMSRSNHPFGALEPWARALEAALGAAVAKGFKFKHFVFNGEFKAVRHKDDPKNWKSSWGKSIALAHAGITATGYDPANIDEYTALCLKRDLVFTIYNCYPFETYTTGSWDMPYGHTSIPNTRSALIKQFVAYVNKHFPDVRIQMIEQRLCHNMKELKAAHATCIANKAEGSMIKRVDKGVTLDRTADFVKWKQYRNRDAVILSVNRGTGKYKDTAGALVCYLPDIDDIAKVTCRTEEIRDWAWTNREIIAGFMLETRDDAGDDEVAKTRNPTLARFRNDVPPMPVREVITLCHRFDLPKPKSRLTIDAFNKVTASFKL
jgi:hypothetical protein